MRLRFGPDDDDAFQRTRDALLEDFSAYLERTGYRGVAPIQETVADAEIALDWKYSYGGGELDRWDRHDVREFLLEWCPRKLSVAAEDAASIPASFATLLTFLGDAGHARGAQALGPAALALSGQFLQEMADPANFGLAKSLFAGASADGVDMTSEADLGRWVEQFNQRSADERRQVIPDTAFASGPALPPVVLPTDDELAASHSAAPILSWLASFAEYAGTGRKLTQNGNLTLADARALVTLLDTGDVMDPVHGTKTFRTTSSAELPTLALVFRWARKAGVVRVAHSKVIATKKSERLRADPGAFFDVALDALLELGVLSGQRGVERYFAWPQVDALLDDTVVHLLAIPYAAAQPVELGELAEVATDAVLGQFRFRASDDVVERRVASDVARIVDALRYAGLLQWVEEPLTDDSVGTREGGTVRLTPAGVVAANRLLLGAGYDVPVAGTLAQVGAIELVDGCVDGGPDIASAQVDAWLARRDPADAAAELAQAVRAFDGDPHRANAALGMLTMVNADIALPHVRDLLAFPSVRGQARCVLVDAGVEPPTSLVDLTDPVTFGDVLAYRLVEDGTDALIATLALVGSTDAQAAAVEPLWRSTSIGIGPVLDTLGSTHPHKVVAKAARKAAFKYRGRG